MDHKAWLEWRRGGLGSSDVAVLMGVHGWKTKYDIWKEKVHELHENEDNEAMAHGREMEPIARKWIEDNHDIFLEPRNIQRDDCPWMRCSIDAITFDGKRIYEIKCPFRNAKDHELAINGKIPEKYLPQLMWIMCCSNTDSITYISKHPYADNYAEVVVFKDPIYCNLLEAEAHNFWHEHVLKRLPPEMTDKDLRDFEGDPDWKNICQLYKENKHMLELYEKKDKALREEIVSLTKGASAMGNGLKVLKSDCEGRIDYDKAIDDFTADLKRLFPNFEIPIIDLERYRKPSTTRFRFTIQ
jgi:putative phage-type endonuclease